MKDATKHSGPREARSIREAHHGTNRRLGTYRTIGVVRVRLGVSDVAGLLHQRVDVMEVGRSEISNHGNKVMPGSNDPHVLEVVRQAHEELRQLMRQRADVMKRIGTVKQTIVGLANLFGDEVLNEELLELVDRKSNGRQPGFTKACRMVLMEAERPLGAREVCELIQQKIPPILSRHKDPLASVTTVLNRLVEYGEARTIVKENGRRAWQWISDPANQSASGRHGLPRA